MYCLPHSLASDGNIQYDGTDLIINPSAVGSGDLEVRGNLRLESDNDKLFFGTGKDASIFYTGTNLNIDPREVGSGSLRIVGETFIDGVSDDIQLRVQGNGTQTSNLATFEDSSTNVQVSFDGSGGAIFNEEGNDADFRVEGSTEPNLLFVDGSADRIGMGTASPDATLEIVSKSATQEAIHLRMAASTTSRTLLITDSVNTVKAFHELDETDSGEPVNALVIGTNQITNPANVIEARRDIEGVASGESVSGAQRGAYFTIANSKVTNVTSGQTALARFVFFSDGTVGGGVNSSGELGNVGFSSATDDGTTFIVSNRTQADTASIRFVTRDGGRKPLTLLGSGLVGINEQSPDSELEVVSRLATTPTLHIKGATSQTADLFNATNSADTSLVTIDASGDLALTQDNGKALFGAGKDASILYDGSDMVFDSQEVGSGNYLFAGGNVAIGATTADTALEVVGDITSRGTEWTTRTSAADNNWNGITYGNGRFVAISTSGTGNRVMTSPDGVNWTLRTSAEDNTWSDITYGNGLFVAISSDGTNRVMTSPDGITWTSRSAVTANPWRSITYGEGLFVAVSSGGITNLIMTSPDGITWTGRVASTLTDWTEVTYGNGVFVAVNAINFTRVMTSPDGITWTNRTGASLNPWQSVTYGNGLFVAVASNNLYVGTVMTSPNGIDWTSRTAATDTTWYAITYGNGLFVVTSFDGEVMTSPNGIDWTLRTAATTNQWLAITYGNGIFVSVSKSGTGDRVMTSGKIETNEPSHDNIYQGGMSIFGDVLINGGLVAGMSQTEIDVGAMPVSYASVAVVDASITTASYITGGVAYKAPTGKDLDEMEMDSFDLKFEPLAGSFNVKIKGLEGSISDKFIIWYNSN